MNLPSAPALDTVADDLAAFGAEDVRLPDWMLEQDEAEDFGVLPENWDAVTVFLSCTTQWLPDHAGLRYEGVDVVMKHMAVKDPADAFQRLRVMELAAIKEFRALAAEQG